MRPNLQNGCTGATYNKCGGWWTSSLGGPANQKKHWLICLPLCPNWWACSKSHTFCKVLSLYLIHFFNHLEFQQTPFSKLLVHTSWPLHGVKLTMERWHIVIATSGHSLTEYQIDEDCCCFDRSRMYRKQSKNNTAISKNEWISGPVVFWVERICSNLCEHESINM